MVQHLDRQRLVFWVDGEPSYHERRDRDTGDLEQGRCGRTARSRAHECTALVAEVMGLEPCPACRRVVERETAHDSDRALDRSGRRGGPRVRGVIFDVDGVVTRTATVHAEAWRAMFDAYLRERSARDGVPFVAFTDEDYRRHIDGKARFDGVADFLRSRGIRLPHGDPDDPPDRETVCGLGNRKNLAFIDEVRRNGAAPYPSTLVLLRRLGDEGIPTAAVSASENCAAVLAAAGASDLFATRVDGVDARELDLAGKPDPALFLEAARRLGLPPASCTVVEDAIAGVEAGRRGGFGTVIGVDRTAHPAPLREHGADVVVPDLSWVDLDPAGHWRVSGSPPTGEIDLTERRTTGADRRG